MIEAVDGRRGSTETSRRVDLVERFTGMIEELIGLFFLKEMLIVAER